MSFRRLTRYLALIGLSLGILARRCGGRAVYPRVERRPGIRQQPFGPSALGRLYRQRGQIYELLGDFEPAQADYQAALTAAQATHEMEALWQAQIDLGFLWAQRDYSQAGDFFSQALTTARQLADPQRPAHTLKRLGNWHMNVEHPEASVPMLTEALQIFETLGDSRGIAETLDVLGIANFAAANAIDGSRHYARALALFRQLNDPGGELNVLGV